MPKALPIGTRLTELPSSSDIRRFFCEPCRIYKLAVVFGEIEPFLPRADPVPIFVENCIGDNLPGS